MGPNIQLKTTNL